MSSELDRRAFVAQVLAATAVAGCSGGSPAEPPPAPSDPDDLGPVGDELVIYNWSDYVAEDTIPAFEKEFGVEVEYTSYESSEELLAKLRVGASGYDIVVPPSNVLTTLAGQDLLLPLVKRYLTNWGNVAPTFLNPKYDPDNRFGVPYQWGLTGIAWRTDKITAPPTSWSVFHDKALAGKVTQLEEMRDVIGCWLKFRGASLNSRVEAELLQAKADALLAKPQVAAYVSAAVKGQLVAGDIWLAQAWNGEVAQARVEQPNLAFTVPKEGGGIWTDSMVVLRSAPHKRAAHEFMNYVLRPEVGAALSAHTGYGSPNAAATARMASPVPYPTAEELARLEYQEDLGEALELWDRIWTEIKSA